MELGGGGGRGGGGLEMHLKWLSVVKNDHFTTTARMNQGHWGHCTVAPIKFIDVQ